MLFLDYSRVLWLLPVLRYLEWRALVISGAVASCLVTENFSTQYNRPIIVGMELKFEPKTRYCIGNNPPSKNNQTGVP